MASIPQIEATLPQIERPEVRIGDTVRVHVRIIEGSKELLDHTLVRNNVLVRSELHKFKSEGGESFV